jgi:hypothetical protein
VDGEWCATVALRSGNIGSSVTLVPGCHLSREFLDDLVGWQTVGGIGLGGPARALQCQTELTDAAVIALIIAGSIAANKAMGRPCACPSDLMRNGRVCGGNSAWSRPGGYKPLCFASDVTPGMISAYRATKAIPALK